MSRYLDVDSILCEEERIPCVFQVDGAGLGFLDSSNDNPNLPAGSRVELPLWMAKTLTQKMMTTMELPKYFERRMRDNIAAGASNINLREFSSYYFEVGMQIAAEKKDKDLQDTLRIAFSGDRFRPLMVNSLSSSKEDSADFAHNLTVRELMLFHAGMKMISLAVYISCI